MVRMPTRSRTLITLTFVLLDRHVPYTSTALSGPMGTTLDTSGIARSTSIILMYVNAAMAYASSGRVAID